MHSKAATVDEYIAQLSDDRKEAILKIRKIILKNLPKGFEECMGYGMIGYVVPHTIYPKGYRCNPTLPLPFMNIASQKNFIAVHSMGIYAKKEMYDWFVTEYAKQVSSKLDIGKGCIRFKKIEQIPYKLLGELASKLTVQEYIELVEKTFNR